MSPKPSIRIATRRSALALWQAEHVAARLRAAYPDVEAELVAMTTRGDKLLATPLADIGGKGLFIKELEHAIMDGRADIAVHSMKDVPNQLPTGFTLAAVLPREDPRDAFVSGSYPDLAGLPAGARVGTCSLRRRCQLASAYPQIELIDLRGNVNTRLRRLDDGEFDAIILAAAGLIRLGLPERIRGAIPPELCLPAAAQGAIGIECRDDAPELRAMLTALADADTEIQVSAERAFNRRLEGSCQVPIAAYAEFAEFAGGLRLRGLVGLPDGSRIVAGEREGPATQPEALGLALAEQLLDQGAGEILARCAGGA